ncbi:MAG: DUF402 domain-containing protein [Alphaproteobacteria bacterium]|nr:DUF402 domain-containing protein [Alphaproteobacteria bacterium]MBL6937181.1 DUF402 domain-containing protein [Alphaproteobacteria bacterium]MBL7096257.1 DUF402 domain-containing protein [Alphaproteobacteria bacterium]
MTWKPGATVVVRNIARSDEGVTAAMAAIAVQDGDDALALYVPVGTVAKDNYVVPEKDRVAAVGMRVASRARLFVERVWQVPTIRLYLPDTAFSVWLFFGTGGAFASWYGNMEAPYQRTPIGVDAQDHGLDVVADAKGRWRWKDEAEFARRLELGVDSAEHQAAVRATGRDFIARLKANASPFNRGWQNWRAPDGWTARALPDGWDADYGTHAPPRS